MRDRRRRRFLVRCQAQVVIVKHVSVILPAFNASATLAGCLTSLLSNDHPSFEVILVDDGSSDDSLVVAAAMPGKGRLKTVAMAHGGPARARNRGIEEARGDYIFFTDADRVNLLRSGRDGGALALPVSP